MLSVEQKDSVLEDRVSRSFAPINFMNTTEYREMFGHSEAPIMSCYLETEKAAPAHTFQGSVLVAKALDSTAIAQLLSGSIACIFVPNFFDQNLCQSLAGALTSELVKSYRESYPHEITLASGERILLPYGVDRIGKTYNQIRGCGPDDPRLLEYFRSKQEVEAIVRKVCDGSHPIEDLMRSMSRYYVHGAQRESIHDHEAFIGVGRVNSTGKHPISEDPHVDGSGPYYRHFSLIMYLQTPPAGGELGIFRETEFTQDEICGLAPDCDFKLKLSTEGRDLVPVKTGDLCILNTRHPHYTKPFYEGSRIAMNVFFGYNPGEQLRFYS